MTAHPHATHTARLIHVRESPLHHLAPAPLQAAGRLPWPGIDVERALPWVARKTGLSLAPGQAEAVRLALTSKAVVITGGPGVGKTTIVDAILRILAAKGVELVLCAPTGRAARRMSEATGSEARTIHRLLEVDPRTGGFRRDADNPLDCGLLVVDEASMVDVPLMRALLAAVPNEAAVLIVGDVDQLPSVGPGQVLADIIASGAVAVVRLTEVFRQAARRRIVTSAHGINRARSPISPGRTATATSTSCRPRTRRPPPPGSSISVKARIPRRFGLDAVRDIQVLCPMNRGGVGARSLNIELQAALNPAGERKVERFGWIFAPGDKVMQIENDYDKEVYNGDIGRIADVDPDAGELNAAGEPAARRTPSATAPTVDTPARDRSAAPSSRRSFGSSSRPPRRQREAALRCAGTRPQQLVLHR